MDAEAAIATARFGLGPKRGELAQAGNDPRGWVKQQIAQAGAMPPGLSGFEPGSERMAELLHARGKGDAEAQKIIRRQLHDAYLAEAAARTLNQIETDAPVIERLVAFWSNHFTVSVQRPFVLGLVCAFEREAIRPHVTGRFLDMLMASTRHPAMLIYLDNAQSIGPNSIAGRRRDKGLNENLARELLELHTLGVDGGYTQNDVREFARILTGWSVARLEEGDAGAFEFHERIHEPGEKVLLGRRYGQAGEAEGKEALAALARHPATARHIGAKLARHFIADNPPQAAVERLAEVFTRTDGDLRAVTLALVDSPEAWAEPLAKIKTPNEFVVSALRATGFRGKPEVLLGSLKELGQAPFAAPSPAGWPDTADQWIGPESVLRRAEWAMALALRAAPWIEPRDLFAETIGPVAKPETKTAVERAPSAADAAGLVFASAEFQRR